MKIVIEREALSQAIARRGLNRKKLAECCNVGVHTISKALKGEPIYPSSYKGLCKGLGGDLDAFISVIE